MLLLLSSAFGMQGQSKGKGKGNGHGNGNGNVECIQRVQQWFQSCMARADGDQDKRERCIAIAQRRMDNCDNGRGNDNDHDDDGGSR
jgi:hypothetical protein